MAGSNQIAAMPWLMTTNAEARFVRLEERVETQGQTLSRIDGTMDRIAGVLENIAVQAQKIEHISDSVDDVKRSVDDHGNRLMVAERDIERLKHHIKDLQDDVGSLQQSAKEADQQLSRHRPVIKALIWVGTAFGASVLSLIWALITGKIHINWGA